ncbi:MAG: hypothetical protein M0Z41_03565 [Peptococcaceae bacterium]|jgi:hypothetical protein|nr:hypothetical protein [Peptococcaceae bacterium]
MSNINVMERMMTTMMERMMDKMSAVERRAMMQDMMGQMVGEMAAEDRMAFMRSMMQACLPMITEGLDAAARIQMIHDIIGTLAQDTQQSKEDNQSLTGSNV